MLLTEEGARGLRCRQMEAALVGYFGLPQLLVGPHGVVAVEVVGQPYAADQTAAAAPFRLGVSVFCTVSACPLWRWRDPEYEYLRCALILDHGTGDLRPESPPPASEPEWERRADLAQDGMVPWAVYRRPARMPRRGYCGRGGPPEETEGHLELLRTTPAAAG